VSIGQVKVSFVRYSAFPYAPIISQFYDVWDTLGMSPRPHTTDIPPVTNNNNKT